MRDGRLYASENHQEILKVSHHCGPAGVDASYCTRVNVNCIKRGKSHSNFKDKRVEYIGINKQFFLLPLQSIYFKKKQQHLKAFEQLVSEFFITEQMKLLF